jgi:two-component system, sporulation sensor kinase E
MIENIAALVIEEREEDYLKLKNLLDQQTEWNISTSWANSYNEGLKEFKNSEIDICFLDTNLGNQTGQRFLDLLKGLKHHVPIILIGYEKDKIIRQLDETDGVDDFLYREKLTPLLVSKSLKYGIDTYKYINKLRIQAEKYNNLFYSSMEAVFTADDNFKILKCNEAFKNLFKVENVDDFDFRDLFIDNDYESIFQSLSASTQNKKLYRTRVKTTDGSILSVYVSISRILYNSDETSFQGVLHDITELENAEKERIQADKLKLMSRMARILGHEVRNPLSNIVLASEELRVDNEDNEDMVMMLGMIHRNAKRISVLIDSFLNNTRHSELQKENTIIEEAIHEAISNCKDRMTLKNINFISYGIDSQHYFHIDHQKIVIAITNILINAIEAVSSNDSPKLFVDLKVENDTASITIKDNGCGMSAETKENLFTPFYSSKQGGLGLGMTNTKNIFDLHKAKVIVESEINIGTTFLISIPKTNNGE